MQQQFFHQNAASFLLAETPDTLKIFYLNKTKSLTLLSLILQSLMLLSLMLLSLDVAKPDVAKPDIAWPDIA